MEKIRIKGRAEYGGVVEAEALVSALKQAADTLFTTLS